MVPTMEQLRALPLAIQISVLPAPSWTTLAKSWNASWPVPTLVTINNGDLIGSEIEDYITNPLNIACLPLTPAP